VQVSRVTDEEVEALKIARELIDAGVPVFAAAPNPEKPGEYYLPPKWQFTPPDPTQLDRWQPGWALGAVGGGPADFLDFDPRNGGDQSLRELEIQKQVPRTFGVQSTPSGGTHLVISPTGERKATGFMPGVDLQAGSTEADEYGSHGRGFVYIAPTVRPSKAPETLGQLRPYRWEQPPDLAYLSEFAAGTDDTLDGIVARVHAARTAVKARESALSAPGGSQLFAGGSFGPSRAFTLAEAQEFCLPHLDALSRAPIGAIEESANAAAVALAHFVPTHWSADEAFAVLKVALSSTAYDPTHPASGWTVEKFRPVLDGRRPPLDGWKAARAVSPAEAAAAFGQQGTAVTPVPEGSDEADAMVNALLAEMLSADQLSERPAPKPLIKGLLNLDSIAWTIGAPGSKKSFVALSMAAHVARGMPWQGLTVHQGPVVLIVAEGAGGMSTRVKAWQRTYGPIGGVDVFRVLPRPVQVTDTVGWQVLVEACRRIKPVLVVIDTQARVTVGMEENSAKEMGVFVEAAERIRQATGACVSVVHHTGRTGGDARGSSAIDGAQSTELKVIRQDGLTGVLKVEKQKDLQERSDMPLFFDRVVLGLDEDGDEISSLVLIEANAFRSLGEGEVAPERGQEVSIPEPEPWTVAAYDHNRGENVRRILTIIRHVAGEHGATEADVRRILLGRWYDGRPMKPKRAGHLDPETWVGSWTKALDLKGADGNRIIEKNPDSARYWIHPDFLSDLN
jgi:AAA domain/Bifunctional DNA primase/polymerase, N-terminal